MSDGTSPVVGILMGSDSDWPKIQSVAAALDEFQVPHEVRVMSAHRTPEIVRQYAGTAAQRGLKVIIAAAGGAAHLAGVVASHTTVQMPGDVPVATVGLGSGGARNAGLLAVEILALGDRSLQEKLTAFKQKLVEKINSKDAALRSSLGDKAAREAATELPEVF
jgi:5-(carboxyamino)imidazole ribonucleotide mutase